MSDSDGKTIHSFVSHCRTKKALNTICVYIFIDEISMVPEMFYKFFITLKKLQPDAKFIVAGGFEQLLPVNDRVRNCNYKQSNVLNELCDGNRSSCLNVDEATEECIMHVEILRLRNRKILKNEWTE